MNPSRTIAVAAASITAGLLGQCALTQAAPVDVYFDNNLNTVTGSNNSTSSSNRWDDNTTAFWTDDPNGEDTDPNKTYSAQIAALGGDSGNAIFSAGTNATGANRVYVTGAVAANSILVEEGSTFDFYGQSTPVLSLGGGGLTIGSGVSSTSSFNSSLSSLILTGNQIWTNNSTSVFTNSAAATVGDAGNAALRTLTLKAGSTGGITLSGGLGDGAGGGKLALIVDSANVATTADGTTLSAVTTFSGTSTYGGGTTIKQGNAKWNNLGGMGSSGAISVGAGGRLDTIANADLARILDDGVATGGFLRISALQGTGTSFGRLGGTLELNVGNLVLPYTVRLGSGSGIRQLVSTNAKLTADEYRAEGAAGTTVTFDAGTASPTYTVPNSTSSTTPATVGLTTPTSGVKTLIFTAASGGSGTFDPGIYKGSGDFNILKTGAGTWSLTDGASGGGGSKGRTDITGSITIREGILVVHGSLNTSSSKSSVGTGDISVGDLPVANGGTASTLDAYLGRQNVSTAIANNVLFPANSTNTHVGFAGPGTGTNQPNFLGTITANRDIYINQSTGGALRFSGLFDLKGNTLTINNGGTGVTSFSGTVDTAAGAALDITNTNTGPMQLDGVAFQDENIPVTLNQGGISFTASAFGSSLGTGTLTVKDNTNITFSNNGFGPLANSSMSVAAGATTSIRESNGNNSEFRFPSITLGANGVGSKINYEVSGTSASGAIILLDLGAVTLNGDSTFDTTVVSASTTLGAINIGQGITGGYGIIKTGTQSLIIGGTTTTTGSGTTLVSGRSSVDSSLNNYTGDTTISAGSLRFGRTNALPVGTTVNLASGATLDLSVASRAISTASFDGQVGGLNDVSGAGGTVTANSTSSNFGGTTRNLTLGGGGAYAFSGVIVDKTGAGTGKLALTKSGAGTQELKGDNTYSGGTTVNQGLLKVNNSTGSGTGSGVVVVDGTSTAFGTLGGRGSVAGAVTVQGFGHLAPGNSAGILTANNGVTFGADTTFDVEIDGTTAGGTDTLGTNGYDRLAVTAGDVSLAGNLALDITYNASGGEVFYIVDNQTGATTNTFANLADDATVATFNGYAYKITYDAVTGGALNGGNDVAIYTVAVPEPTSLAVIGLIGGGLLSRRRRTL